MDHQWVRKGERVAIRWLDEGDAEALFDLQLRNRPFFQWYAPDRDEKF
jgi:hypothetical protein